MEPQSRLSSTQRRLLALAVRDGWVSPRGGSWRTADSLIEKGLLRWEHERENQPDLPGYGRVLITEAGKEAHRAGT